MEDALQLSMGRGWESFEVHARNMDIQDDSDEAFGRKEKHTIGNCRKHHPTYNWQRTCLKCFLVFYGRANL